MADKTTGVVTSSNAERVPQKLHDNGDGTYSKAAYLSPGESHIGETHSSGGVIDVVLSLDTNIYADGDVLADTQAVANLLRVANGTAGLYSLTVLDRDDVGQALDIYFLRSNTSIGTENDALNLADAAALEILGRVQVDAADYVDVGGAKVAFVPLSDQAVPLLTSAATTGYIAAVARGAATYSATGLVLKLGVLRN
jgi:hypothetical protein